MIGKYKKYLKLGLSAILLFILGFTLPYLYNSISAPLSVTNLDRVLVNSPKQTQYEFVLVYIGCSTCGAANFEGLPEAFLSVGKSIELQAQKYGYSLHKIGISKDDVLIDELNHLAKYGQFDEILIGNNWSNTGILKYMYNDIPGPIAVPQIIITKRRFRSTVKATETIYGGLDNEHLIVRKVGVDEIIKYAELNAPLLTDAFNFDL